MARDNLPIVLLALGGGAALWYWSRMRSGGGVTLPAGGGNPNYYSSSASNMVDTEMPAPIRDEVLPVKLDPSAAVLATLPGVVATMPTPTLPMSPSIVYTSGQPRGIRLNNPGNIEKNSRNQWVGLAADQSADPRYATFSQPIYGIRAMAYIIYRSYAARGVNTLQGIISEWAPGKDQNNVPAYVSHVSQLTGIPAGAVVPAWGVPLIAAIITHENGRQPYALATIAQGINMARSA